MFGGLEIKGGDEDPKSIDAGSSATPAPAASAFGFLNSGSSTEATEAPAADPCSSVAAASSGFAFLNAAAPAPEPAPAVSGFSFLSPPAETVEATATTTETTTVETSGFDFLIPSPSNTIDENAETKTSSAAAAPTSAFGFLSGGSQDEADAAPAPAAHYRVASSASSVVSAPSPVPTGNDYSSGFSIGSATTATANSSTPAGLPTGAGITFGTANKPVVRKKKVRAQRVGMGTSAVATATPPKAAPAAACNAASSSPAQDTRDAAAEAQRRAEQFMAQKTVETNNSSTPPPKPAPSKLTIPTYDDPVPSLAPTASNDEEVARAQRAAKEAKKIAQAGGDKQRGGFMGTFFKGFGGSSSSIGKSSGSNHSGPPRRSSPPPTTTVDTLSKQQQEMKKAAAERQIQMQMHRQVSDLDEDEVVVSTTTSGYTAEATAPSPPTYRSTPSDFRPVEPAVKTTGHNTIVVREMTPAPRKKKTATQAFEEFQALFAQSVHRAMQQVERVRSQQKMLSEERFVSLAKQRLATRQIEQTETQLQLAVENEDYELADQLGQVIERHKREMSEVASVLESIAKGLEQLESQKALVVQGVGTCFDNLAVHIKDLKENEIAKDRDSDAEAFKQFASISKHLSAEQERLNQDLKHLERDEEVLAQERSELESAISEQSGEYEKQRDDVKTKLETVEEEIAELRRQLEAKGKIAAGLRTEMHGLEDSISKVRVKFSRQLARVEKKERTIQENRIEWETETAMFKRQKEAHELQVQTHSEALLEHDTLMNTMENELALCKEFAGLVSTKLGLLQTDTKAKVAEDSNAESNLAQLQADVVKCEAACSEAKIIFEAAKAALTNLEAEHAHLITRIPQLESEKKAAAAKRDFKAASKASKEIKDATARLKECEEELVGDATEKKKVAEGELNKLTSELEKARKIANEEEKVSGIARMVELAEQIKTLVATKKDLCGDVSSNENTVKGVGAFVLDGQIKALRDEGENLGCKYGGWVDLVREALGEDVEQNDGCNAMDTEQKETGTPAQKVDDGLTSEERVAKAQGLIKNIQETEEELNAAAEKEDFEEAARLQDMFEKLQSELEEMDLSEEEIAIVFADDEANESGEALNDVAKPPEKVVEESVECASADEAGDSAALNQSIDDQVEEKKNEETNHEAEPTDDGEDNVDEPDDTQKNNESTQSQDNMPLVEDEAAGDDSARAEHVQENGTDVLEGKEDGQTKQDKTPGVDEEGMEKVEGDEGEAPEAVEDAS